MKSISKKIASRRYFKKGIIVVSEKILSFKKGKELLSDHDLDSCESMPIERYLSPSSQCEYTL